ncbi:hypothetical protein [Pseudoalteromonas luteoviolacea]|uniref:Nucleotide-diphospho-sugar transferase domain-containing protein n=1 Tax=Pseudoalteromonas luteoviolacea DSM 6061 TaxID=1365250 RepID=A0A166V1B0_9GAMM|nr:hypothetical protein [Pseudoalteromonas luteoviolacea]KZN31620.1 hypothetical protein N475_22990 [Pseudoalteromonas luteoviolacea DSM 6061]KZN53097.1 hypothetical protein N474_22130 [Pseudoalteromonas luteoviolacea CPMOR-2]MBE0389780.1 hypothetical protein [Pseudoalteromonas luteoviolacea DSM 6061]TQF67638.1 hypothetical protein FLM44_20870 [Pseudoalteromonas luteoviolacea]
MEQNSLEKFAQSFVYIIYGKQERHYLEAQLSIASLVHHNPEAQICVLAECHELFDDHPQLKVIPLTDDMKREWMGEDGYHFKLKLAGLKYLLEQHAHKIIFLDTDTLVKAPIMDLFDLVSEKHTLLHEKEGDLTGKRFAKQHAGVIGKAFSHPEFGDWLIEADMPMYNSGLIGICDTHCKHLDSALWLMPLIDAHTTIHTAEQFALGIILCRHQDVSEVGHKRVYHYWHKKPRKYIFEETERLVSESKGQCLYSNSKIMADFRYRRPILRWLKDKLGL